MGTDRFGFTSLSRRFTLDVWNKIPGFNVLTVKNGYIVLRYKGGSVRDLFNAIRAEPMADRCRLSFIVFGKKHKWSFDYEKQLDRLRLYRLSSVYGLEKKKCKKTSRFYGVSYERTVTSNENWMAFYYVVREEGEGKDRKMIARYTNEHEAAIAHDVFMLWWKQRGRLNYTRLKRPLDVEEFYLHITPKEQFMSGSRPDCYACVHHKELPANARIECRADGATVIGHPIAYKHDWFNYPFNFDPLWVQSCDRFMPKGGIHEQEQEGRSKEKESREESRQCPDQST